MKRIFIWVRKECWCFINKIEVNSSFFLSSRPAEADKTPRSNLVFYALPEIAAVAMLPRNDKTRNLIIETLKIA